MGSIYPGQTLSFHLVYTAIFERAVFIKILDDLEITYKSNKSSSIIQLNQRSCTKVEYLLKHTNGRWCELSFSVEAVGMKYVA